MLTECLKCISDAIWFVRAMVEDITEDYKVYKLLQNTTITNQEKKRA